MHSVKSYKLLREYNKIAFYVQQKKIKLNKLINFKV